LDVAMIKCSVTYLYRSFFAMREVAMILSLFS